jgi:hypothetical protein
MISRGLEALLLRGPACEDSTILLWCCHGEARLLVNKEDTRGSMCAPAAR